MTTVEQPNGEPVAHVVRVVPAPGGKGIMVTRSDGRTVYHPAQIATSRGPGHPAPVKTRIRHPGTGGTFEIYEPFAGSGWQADGWEVIDGGADSG